LQAPQPAGQCASDDALPSPHHGERRRSLHKMCSPLRIRPCFCPPPKHGCSAATPASWRLCCRQRVATLFSSCDEALVNANPSGVFEHHPLQGDMSRHRCRCCAIDVRDAGCRTLEQGLGALPRCEAPEATAKEDDHLRGNGSLPQGSPCNCFPDAHSCRGKRTMALRLCAGWGATALTTSIMQHVRCERQLRRQHA